MSVRHRNTIATLVLIVVLLALPAAAAIQTVWLNAASRGEIETMRRTLGGAVRQLRSDLLVEYASIATLLSVELEDSAERPGAGIEQLSEVFPGFYRTWESQTRFPGLVADILYVGPLTDWRPHRYDVPSATFVPLANSASDEQAALEMIEAEQRNPDALSIIVPLSRTLEQVGAGGEVVRATVGESGYFIVRLSRPNLATVVAPELLDTYLGSDAGDYDIAIVDEAAGDVAWSSFDITFAELASGELPRPDERMTLSPSPRGDPAFRVPDDLVSRFRDPLLQQWLEFRRRGEDDGSTVPEAPPQDLVSVGGPTVLIWHRAGSIETAARLERNRNLALSYAILIALAGVTITYYLLFRRANRLREREQEFVATVTHELRTPVAAIHAVADNLAEGIVTRPDQVRRYGKAMLEEGRRLASMIDHVLLYAGLQAREGTLRVVDLQIDDVIARTVERLPHVSRDRVVADVEPGMPVFRGDPIAVESVIGNLLSNAAKHNDEQTEIRITARADRPPSGGSGDDRFVLVVKVADNGRGIPKRELRHVREPFFRGARSQADQVPGSGIGLSLVTRIVRACGGTMSVTSKPAEGTTVVVRLPSANGAAHGA